MCLDIFMSRHISWRTMSIGILGYQGRLGSQLVHMGCEPIDYDITSKKKLGGNWDVVINCAAITDVDWCEDQKNYWKAIEVNAYGVRDLAESYSGEIIHISTDYVFSGKRGPYSENYNKSDDLPTNRMAYSLSKWVGEQFAKEHEHVKIIRTTGLYGGVSKQHDFVKMILTSYKTNLPAIQVSKDLRGNQTYIPHLAEALIMYAETKQKPKVLHIASKEVISRYEFALMIASVFDLDKEKIKPVKSEQIPMWIAERPKKGGLKVSLAEKLGLPIYTILEGLEAYKSANI